MTEIDPPPAWCEISTARIEANLGIALAQLPKGARLCAVLKSDAYGHGIGNVVPIILRAGIDRVGITSNGEARAVRDAGFAGEIIRLRAATPAEVVAAIDLRIEEQVGSREMADCLMNCAERGAPIRAHLALNALGMSRDGLELSTDAGREECEYILARLRDRIVAICTHFPNNAPDRLRRSAAIFEDHANWVRGSGFVDPVRCYLHAGSSLTLLSGVGVRTDMYRCGALLFGILAPDLGFRPSMALKSRVVSVHEYPAGASVGYDESITLQAPRRLACLSIGYANGVRRTAQNCGSVRFGDAYAPLVGKVSMNSVIVDVSGLTDVCVGSVAEICGDPPDGGVPDIAAQQQFQTILADLYTDWGCRNLRMVDRVCSEIPGGARVI